MHSIHKNLNQQSRMDASILNYLNTTTIGILISVLVIISSCLLLFRPSKVGNVREPPMVGGAWPVIGHLPLLSKSKTPHKTLGAIADKYGPLFTIKLGAKQVLVLSNWEMAKECFTKNDKLVSTRPKLVSIENLSYNKAMFGLAPYGPYWRELRKIVTLELLCNRRIELLRHVRVSEVEASIKDLFNLWTTSRNNELGYVLVEMKHWFAQLTFNVVLRMIVGKRFFGVKDLENGERIIKIMRDFMRMFGVFPVADAVPSLRWLDLEGHEKHMKKIAKELDEIMCEWLDEHRQNRGLNEKDDDASDQDFMDVMLSVLNDAKIDQFDADTIIKATSLSMILGGTDTTSVTLTWTMSLLMRNPHVLKKAKEELDSQIGKERCVSETDINKLVYLQAIVKETLRLYPAAPLVGIREFTEDCILGGYHVKKGTRLFANLWKIHTDPSIWSDDPLEFKPERFLTTHKDVDFRGQHFEFVPFGSGRRMCPGVSFGLQIVHLTLATFLHSFDILNPSSEPVDMTETLGLTNEKTTPLEILVKPCLSPSCCYETM